MSQPDRPKLDIGGIKAPGGGMNIGTTLQSAKNLAKLGTQMLASKLVRVMRVWRTGVKSYKAPSTLDERQKAMRKK